MSVCPKCLSKYQEIHGLIFHEDGEQERCEHSWHYQGKKYDELNLSPKDVAFLESLKIKV